MVTMGKQGRIVIPAEARKKLNLKEGDNLEMTVHDEYVEFRRRLTPQEAAHKLHGLYADVDQDLVGELIAERRAEAERE